MSRKEGGRGLTRIEDNVDASIQGLEEYIKKSKERHYSGQKSIMIYRTTARKQMEKKNNCIDISSDKQAKSHTERLRKGNLKREIYSNNNTKQRDMDQLY